MTRSYVGRLQERANREVERELRGAILKLCDMITDCEIDRHIVIDDDDDSPARAALLEERIVLDDAVDRLRFAISFSRKYGNYHLGAQDEAALRLAKEGRRGRAQRARRSRAAEASPSTVTPAPAPMRALPASTRTKRGKAPPPERGEPIYVGGSQLFLLGPGEKR